MSIIDGNMTAELSNKIKSIEVDFIETFSNGFQSDTQYLYQEDFGERLSLLLSSIHYHVNLLLREMNFRMKQENFYYLADSSRKLLACINIVDRLSKISELKNIGFTVDKEYGEIFQKCNQFLKEYNGSYIPTDMEQNEIKYELPIFFIGDTINKKSGGVESGFKLFPIGEGSYAQVFKYFDDFYDKYFVVKRARTDLDAKELERFYKEYEVMKSINSPYVLEVYRLDKNKNEYFMEFADFSLYDFILKNNQKLNFMIRRKLCLQIIRAFEVFDRIGVLHRDISPKNVLLKKYQDEVVVKIADFGLVKTVDSQLTSLETEVRGYFNDVSSLSTEGFKNYNKQYEYYALSKLIYFVLTGRYKNMNKFDFPKLKEFMEKGLNSNHNLRYKAIEELRAAFLEIQEEWKF